MPIDCVSAGHIVFGKPATSLEDERRQIAIDIIKTIDIYQDEKLGVDNIEVKISSFEEKENILARKLTLTK